MGHRLRSTKRQHEGELGTFQGWPTETRKRKSLDGPVQVIPTPARRRQSLGGGQPPTRIRRGPRPAAAKARAWRPRRDRRDDDREAGGPPELEAGRGSSGPACYRIRTRCRRLRRSFGKNSTRPAESQRKAHFIVFKPSSCRGALSTRAELLFLLAGENVPVEGVHDDGAVFELNSWRLIRSATICASYECAKIFIRYDFEGRFDGPPSAKSIVCFKTVWCDLIQIRKRVSPVLSNRDCIICHVKTYLQV